MKQIYIVKSGMLKDFVGWEWLNLAAYENYLDAVEYKKQVEKQIEPGALGNTEDVEIEALTLQG